MLGAYVAYSVGLRTGFFPALVLAPVLVGLFGALVEALWPAHGAQVRPRADSSSPSASPTSSRSRS
jgi:hypothetical protein